MLDVPPLQVATLAEKIGALEFCIVVDIRKRKFCLVCQTPRQIVILDNDAIGGDHECKDAFDLAVRFTPATRELVALAGSLDLTGQLRTDARSRV